MLPLSIFMTVIKISVRTCKLRWYGHITRLTGLAKVILQGMVKGGRRKNHTQKEIGRQ